MKLCFTFGTQQEKEGKDWLAVQSIELDTIRTQADCDSDVVNHGGFGVGHGNPVAKSGGSFSFTLHDGVVQRVNRTVVDASRSGQAFKEFADHRASF